MIFYVKEVQSTIDFYARAFGIKTRFLHESGAYAELETGATSIAFAAEELAESNLPEGCLKHDPKKRPFACEITFTADNVEKAYEKAVKAGAAPLAPPKEKPWGQTVGYVRDPNGILIEIASKLH